MYAYMLWADTTAGIMKMRNGANSAWISLWELDGTFIASDISLAAGSAAAPSLFFTGDTNTGLFSPGADTVALATAGSNRLHITSAGLVGIGTTTLTEKLHVDGNIVTKLGGYGLLFGGSTCGINGDATTNYIQFYTNNVERARLDSSGRWLVGTSTSRSNAFGQASIQLENTGGLLSVTQNANNAFGGAAILAKTRGSAFEAVTNNDNLGILSFQGANGSALLEGARIQANIDGTVSGGGAGDLPTRLVFSTTADGAASPTERFRISSTGAQSSVIPGGSTLYPSFDCRAWVNFNGTGTVAIRGSGNVSSITDNGTGIYTVNFTTAMVDTNYAAQVTSQFETGVSGNIAGAYIYYTTGFVLQNVNVSGLALTDSSFLNVAIFR
jgi:hypothetical protein